MTFPTTVYVVMQVDAEGKPRGFHKAHPLLALTLEQAERAAHGMSLGGFRNAIQECVIMGRSQYEKLVGTATLPMDL